MVHIWVDFSHLVYSQSSTEKHRSKKNEEIILVPKSPLWVLLNCNFLHIFQYCSLNKKIVFMQFWMTSMTPNNSATNVDSSWKWWEGKQTITIIRTAMKHWKQAEIRPNLRHLLSQFCWQFFHFYVVNNQMFNSFHNFYLFIAIARRPVSNKSYLRIQCLCDFFIMI